MISSKCFYALRAMLELSKRNSQLPVSIADIARVQNIPPRFLEAILRELKQAGYTDSARGKDGGYFLAKESGEVTVGEVIRLFEGPLVSVSQLSGNESTDALFGDIWKTAEAALAAVYDGVTFKDLAQREKDSVSNYVMDYSI